MGEKAGLPAITATSDGVISKLLKIVRRQEVVRNEQFSPQFDHLLHNIDQLEHEQRLEIEAVIRRNYQIWAQHYQLLKKEFNAVWDFFLQIEERLEGWYCVSPNLAQWKSVGLGRAGYNFAACIMKNHHRDAPLSEKSLSVTFAMNREGDGIGDERMLGRSGDLTDELCGLDSCPDLGLRKRYEVTKELVENISNKQIVFRLNHHLIGQESSQHPLQILEEWSLVDLSEKLFAALNNDLISQMNSRLSYTEKLLLSAER